eukprot:9471009-Pyramimonas_sp.AAC.1
MVCMWGVGGATTTKHGVGGCATRHMGTWVAPQRSPAAPGLPRGGARGNVPPLCVRTSSDAKAHQSPPAVSQASPKGVSNENLAVATALANRKRGARPTNIKIGSSTAFIFARLQYSAENCLESHKPLLTGPMSAGSEHCKYVQPPGDDRA